MLVIMKELLNIDIGDTSKDNILNFYISKSENSIKNYLNFTDEEWIIEEVKFENQIVDLAMYYYKNQDLLGVIQRSEGSTSIAVERGIPQEIIQSLPMPRIKVVG